MKLFKMLASLIAVSMSLLTFYIPVTANSVSESEMQQVNKALEQYADFLNESEIYGEMPAIEKTRSVSNNIYKSYIINGFIIDEYNETEGFNALISDETKIFAESGNQLVTIVEKNGELEAVGSMIKNDNEELINFESEAERIKAQSKEEIFNLKFLKSYVLGLDMIYYQTDNTEFIVPYFDNVSESVSKTINNGSIYTADEFVGRLNCVLDLSNYNPNSDGGAPYRDVPLEYSANNMTEQSNSFNNIYIAIMVSGLIFLGLIVFISVKTLNRK